jgi:uncharacterized membrane protein YkoI
MKIITKAILPLLFVAASSVAMAEGGSDRTLQRMDEVNEAKPTLKELLKEGEVISIAPAGTAGTTDAMQTYSTNGQVWTYEMKVETPDGKVHAVEYRGIPVGVNNG